MKISSDLPGRKECLQYCFSTIKLSKLAEFFRNKGGSHSKSDNNISKFLNVLFTNGSFNQDIIASREKICLKYKQISKSISRKKAYDILNKYDSLTIEKIENEANSICLKYSLAEEWTLTIVIALISNILQIFEENIPIILDVSSGLSIKCINQVGYDELTRWITGNKKVLKHYLKSLPSKPTAKIGDETVLWGHIAWLYKNQGINSWTKISEAVEKLSNKDEYIPDGVTLQKYYSSFMSTQNRLFTPSKTMEVLGVTSKREVLKTPDEKC